jgi:hypothetical protein
MSSGPDQPQGVEELRADIMVTRKELNATLSELSARVDIPQRAKEKVSAAAGTVAGTAGRVKNAAPEPVKHALDRTGAAVGPVLGRAGHAVRPYRKQIAGALGATAVVAWIVRRRRRS